MLEILAVSLFLTVPFIGMTGMLVLIFLLVTPYWYISLGYVVWWMNDYNTPHRSGRRFAFLRNLSFWKYFARYFPAALHKTANLDPSKNYLFAFHPHGFVSLGALCSFGTNATGFDKLFPGIEMHLLTVNEQLTMPIYRDIMTFLGLSSVNSDTIDYKLTQLDSGHSVCIVIGGAAEAFLSNHNSYTLKLKTRRGFIRKALKNRAPVVPVFSFNEHRIYDIPPLEKHRWFWYYLHKLGSMLSPSMLPMDISGRWPYTWIFAPKPLPINTVVGAPIDFNELKSFKGGQDPTEELVVECHEIYKKALRELYDKHKSRFGDENTPLIFV